MKELNRENLIPKYFQIEEDIVRKIESGELKVHDQVSSEKELCVEYNVSKITARKALQDLTYKSILYRIQGKGTFVSALKIETGSRFLTSFSEEMEKRGFTAKSLEISRSLIIPEKKILKDLYLRDDDKTIVIKRLRFANDEPMGIQTCYLPYKYFHFIYDNNIKFESLYEYIEKELKIKIKNAKESYQAINVGKNDAKILGLNKGDPALFVYRSTFDESDKPIECVESIMRADRYIVVVNLNR